MKKNALISIVSLFIVLFLNACAGKDDFPSPLLGVQIPDVYIDADVTKYTLPVDALLESYVTYETTDLETNSRALWIHDIKLSNGKIEILLDENITINDRVAQVTLKLDGTRNDISYSDVVVIFKVTQKKNSVLEGLDLEEIIIPSEEKDTTLLLGRKLKNMRLETTSLNESSVSWCNAKLTNDYYDMNIKVSENKSVGARQALIRIAPANTNVNAADSLIARMAFLVTQLQNPVLDSLSIDTIRFNHAANKKVIHTGRTLKNIRALVIDQQTDKTASWCSINIQGDSVTVSSTALTTKIDRSAVVTLYLPNNGTTIDSTTISTSFVVVQKHDNIFDNMEIHDHTITWDQKYDTVRVNGNLTGFKCQLIDDETQKSPSWLQAVVKEHSIEFTATTNNSKKSRSVSVTLYMPNGSTIDDNSVKTTFGFHQSGNNIFNGMSFDNQKFDWTSTTKEVKTTLDLGLIKYKKVDNETKKDPSWLQVSFDKDNKTIDLKVSQLTAADDRSATVTLYVQNNGTIIDENTEQVSFQVEQQHFTIFDGAPQKDIIVAWDEKYDTLKFAQELTNIKCRLIDNETEKSPTWLQATVSGKNVMFIAQNNNSKFERSTEVTLYLPNGTTIDANTVHSTFNFKQKGNDLLDKLTIKDQVVTWSQTYDEIKTDVNLSTLKYKIIDDETNKDATWLKMSINENILEIKPSLLTSNKDRSATITLYVQNGTAINETTPQKSFKVTQTHNNIFDHISIANRTLKYNTRYDTLRFSQNLTGIKYQLIDNETQMAPKWLGASIVGKEVIFSLQTNSTLASRSATVTLYLPDGTVDESTVKTSFIITQAFQKKVTPNKNRIEVNYEKQSVVLDVTSTTKYQIKTPEWASCVMTPISETAEKLTVTFLENDTNIVRIDTMRLTSGNEELAKVALVQRTNPIITVNFTDGRKSFSSTKGAAEFELPVKTLTPDYRTKKAQAWVSIGEKKSKNNFDQYYHKVKLNEFTGAGFERFDTITIYNNEYTMRFPVRQHKYIYIDEPASNELELGKTMTLTYHKDPRISSNAVWEGASSAGVFTAEKRGNHTIYAIISNGFIIDGTYFESGYSDKITINVFDIPDKIDVKRGTGNYEKVDGKVTADCPILITNNYSEEIQLNSVGIYSEGNLITGINKDFHELPYTLKAGASVQFYIAERLVEAHNPQVKITFTCKGKTYNDSGNY